MATDVVKQIRRRTRRKFSADEKIRIVLEGLRGEIPITEHPRRTGAHHRLRPLAAGNVRGRDSGTAVSRHPFAGSHLRRISAIDAAAATTKGLAQTGCLPQAHFGHNP